jgi:cytochrome c peroxidase
MRTISYYPALFRAAYGNTIINTNRISQALAQFQRTIVSTNSAWDAGFAANFDARLPDRGVNKPIATFTAQENRGRELFMARAPQGVNCAACHAPPSFALAGNSRSNGLDAAERRVFKAPSLKSVALAGAFMHDGRFSSLEQVVEHYNSGVKLGPALDNRLRTRNGQPRILNLSEADKAALVAFLKTLTDTTLATNPNFSDPFK